MTLVMRAFGALHAGLSTVAARARFGGNVGQMPILPPTVTGRKGGQPRTGSLG